MRPSETLALLQGEGWVGHILFRDARSKSTVTAQPTDAAQLRYFDERWMRLHDVGATRELFADAGPGLLQAHGFIIILATDVKIERG
jgi:hypothetical protein